MRLGQISSIHFVSNLLASAFGFVATIYIARLLGPEPLGIYHLSLAIVAWLSIVAGMGVSSGILKRISEGEEPGAYAVAGFIILGGFYVMIVSGLFIMRLYVNAYVGFPVTKYLILMLFVVFGFGIVTDFLNGLSLVHLSGSLRTVKVGSRSVLQILLVFASFGIVGLFVGHIAGIALATAVGAFMAMRNLPSLTRPKTRHFKSLFQFAKYSWLGELRGQIFNYMDVIVLGFFVSQSLIGIYSVAWNIAQFLILFSGSITSTLFPEMSSLSADGNRDAVSGLVEKSLTYAGLFPIPGLFGSVLLGDWIMRIYGPAFPQGAPVLVILITAILIQGYQQQLLNVLNSVDRPDLAFRVNGIFATANLILNVVLVYLFGWLGAAVATAISVAISFIVSYSYVKSIITFVFPTKEIVFQLVASVVMTSVVYSGHRVVETVDIVPRNVVSLLILIGVGAGVYFVTLLGISTEFRETVDRNLPMDIF